MDYIDTKRFFQIYIHVNALIYFLFKPKLTTDADHHHVETPTTVSDASAATQGGLAMSKSLVVIALLSTLSLAASLSITTAIARTGTDHIANVSLSEAVAPRALYPGNITCKAFEKTGYKTWRLRDGLTVDLGNWDGAFLIKGMIAPGIFISKGIDLFDVLQGQCGLHAGGKA